MTRGRVIFLLTSGPRGWETVYRSPLLVRKSLATVAASLWSMSTWALSWTMFWLVSLDSTLASAVLMSGWAWRRGTETSAAMLSAGWSFLSSSSTTQPFLAMMDWVEQSSAISTPPLSRALAVALSQAPMGWNLRPVMP